MIAWRPLLILSALPLLACSADKTRPPARNTLAWDALAKTMIAQPGDGAAEFAFAATNTSAHAITITSARPSCGCTVVDLPASPWVLAPGARGVLRATVDFTGKDGRLAKSIAIESSEGVQTLSLRVEIAPADEAQRRRNRELAGKNRQAVFRGECASCHVTPSTGRTGEALFLGVCGVCHLAPQRASMVPDLFVARTHRDAAWWRTWIADGRAGTLMPGFAPQNGGSLSPEQIDSLVEFALAKLPTEPRKN